MRYSFLFLPIFTLYLIPCPAQDVKTVENKTVQYKAQDRVVKEDGWDISINEEKESYPTRKTTIEYYPVTVQSYKLKNRAEVR